MSLLVLRNAGFFTAAIAAFGYLGYLYFGVSNGTQEPDKSPAAIFSEDHRDARKPEEVSPEASSAVHESSKEDLVPVSLFGENPHSSDDHVPGDKHPGVFDLDAGATSPQDQRNAITISEIHPEPFQSLVRVQKSKSRQHAQELFDAKEDKSILGTGYVIESDHVHKSELVKTIDFYDESCAVEEGKIYDFQIKENGSSIYPGVSNGTQYPDISPAAIPSEDHRDARNPDEVSLEASGAVHESSKEELVPVSLFGENPHSSDDHVPVDKHASVLDLDAGATSPQDQRNATISDIHPEPFQSLVRVQKSMSRQQAQELFDAKEDKSILGTGYVIAMQQSDHVHKSELVKTVDFYDESCEVEQGKLYDFQSKENGSSIYPGTSVRSQSSGQQSSSTSETSHVANPICIGRSTSDDNNVGCSISTEHQTEENSVSLQRGFGSDMVRSWPQLELIKAGCQLMDTVSSSPNIKVDDVVQLNVNKIAVDIMEPVQQNLTGGSKPAPVTVGISSVEPEYLYELNLVKPVDICYEGCPVEEAKVLVDFQSKEGSNGFSGTSQSRHQIAKESLGSGKRSETGGEGSWPHHKKRKVEGQLSVYASPNLRVDDVVQLNVDKIAVDTMEPLQQYYTGGSKPAPAGISFLEGCAVEEARVGDFQITTASGSSEKQGSFNPELPCICEENEDSYEAADVFQEGVCSEVVPSSLNREPLAKITENLNLPQSISEAEISAARNILESVNTECRFSGTSYRVKQKLGQHNSREEGHTTMAKVSQSTSLGENSINRGTGSGHNRFGKPSVSGKTSLRKGGPSFSEKESQGNNIVSSGTTFIPLVRQKQLEQENLKQCKLERKKKEEERKKKDADMAARKRQREEEEKKKKEQNRKRVMDARKQQRENEEKLRSKKEKEVKCRAMEASNVETRKINKKENEMGDVSRGKVLKTKPKARVISTNENMKAGIVLEDCVPWTDCANNSKVMSNLHNAVEIDNLGTNRIQEQSYDISPYKGSDDEDEEVDDLRNSKVALSQAIKKSVAMLISSLQGPNSKVNFPPIPSCSIDEGKRDVKGEALVAAVIIGMPKDGRCLFHAIGYGACLHNYGFAPDERLQDQIADDMRTRVVEELIKRREDMIGYINGDFDWYISKMRRKDQWGGEPELLMASIVLERPIIVYVYEEAGRGLIPFTEYGKQYTNKSPIRVLFNGYNHYYALEIPVTEKKQVCLGNNLGGNGRPRFSIDVNISPSNINRCRRTILDS